MPTRPAVYRAPGYRSQSLRRRDYEKSRFRNMDSLQLECRRFYSRAAWKHARAAMLRHSPICVFCYKEGRVVIATDVDHNPPLIEQLAKGCSGLEFDKLQTLCKSCHSSKTAREMLT